MKILFISAAGIGDTLLATPLIHEMRLQYPEATLECFVIWPGARDLLLHNPHLNRIHQFNLIRQGPFRSLPFLLFLGRRGYDLSLNTHPQSRIAYRLVARLIGAKTRLSHRYDNCRSIDRLLVTQLLPQDYTRHSVNHNLDFLTSLGRQPLLPSHELEVYLQAEHERWAEEFIQRHSLLGRLRLGLHVGSGGTKNLPLKRWPLDNYIALIKQVVARHPRVSILLFGGPDEVRDHQRIKTEAGNAPIVEVESKNLLQAAALMRHCHAFLSVDTALMHLAAAMKVPNQIVIEAPTLNPTNLPFGNPFHLVPNPAIQGKHLQYYRYDGHGIRGSAAELETCMRAVTPDAVAAALTAPLATKHLPDSPGPA